MSVDITFEGPLFDGRAARAMDEACDDARQDISSYAEERVLVGTSGSFKTRTPYYETRIETTNVSSEVDLVHDNGVIYGPWLEGVGSRNYPATRFKGYGHWRLAKQAVVRRSPDIADAAVRRHLPEMGG
ncbi:hypothetical protein SUDANB1_00475 [Streptomyces sp. enrichment culture]|uniref:hypothetical protein n=1 Tax=Streptomyces sp. enrichment culture TaxID=1795815 RepID=UPI003F544C94